MKKIANKLLVLGSILWILTLILSYLGLAQTCDYDPPWISLDKMARTLVWTNDKEESLSFGGSYSFDSIPTAGFVTMINLTELEDGSFVESVLVTFPRSGGGQITGTWEGVSIPSNAFFIARVGLLSTSQGSDGVGFKVYWEEGGEKDWLVNHEENFDGVTSILKVDLSHLAGRTGNLILRVSSEGNSDQDWAFWEGGFLGTMEPCTEDTPLSNCFDSSGAWYPSGTLIDIATSTVGTAESCVEDGGKAYYQIQLGCDGAYWYPLLESCNEEKRDAQAWCSETIGYWHYKAGLPYNEGYLTDWHPSWQVYNVEEIVSWYITEDMSEGRGVWIIGDSLDYNNFQQGINAPCPGAYQPWLKWNSETDSWMTDHPPYEGSHSTMVGEMRIELTSAGEIVNVHVQLLEGNAGGKIKSTTWLENIYSYTSLGSRTLGDRKIGGWGIDIVNGEPHCDSDKIEYYILKEVAPAPPPIQSESSNSSEFVDYKLIEQFVDYKERLEINRPRLIYTGKMEGQRDIEFGTNIDLKVPVSITNTDPFNIELNIKEQPPLPIKKIEFIWVTESGSRAYPKIKTYLAGLDKKYKVLSKWSPQEEFSFVKVTIPKKGIKENIVLKKVYLEYDWGPDTDAEDIDIPPSTKRTGSKLTSAAVNALPYKQFSNILKQIYQYLFSLF